MSAALGLQGSVAEDGLSAIKAGAQARPLENRDVEFDLCREWRMIACWIGGGPPRFIHTPVQGKPVFRPEDGFFVGRRITPPLISSSRTASL
jgi:hypothetical protein